MFRHVEVLTNMSKTTDTGVDSSIMVDGEESGGIYVENS